MTARPVTGTAKVTVNAFEVSLPKGQILADFDVEMNSAGSVDFVIGSLKANANYLVQRDGTDYHVVRSNTNQCIAFSNSEGANRKFTVIESDQTADITTTEGANIVSPKLVPLPPCNLTASAYNRRVALSWGAPVQDGGSPVTGYNLYRGTVHGVETLLTKVNAATTYEDRNVENGTEYYYRVTAVNATGESWPSNEANARGINYAEAGNKIVVYPNPYVKGKNGGNRILFGNLPPTATLRLYSLSGTLVRSVEHADQAAGGLAACDVSGLAGGIYIYMAVYPGGTQKGKVCIVK